MHKSSRRICDLVSYAHSNGSGLSRRVVRNRGSIDFWEGGGKESMELELMSKINHRGRRQLRPGGNPGT
jgi:hypothetical protein